MPSNSYDLLELPTEVLDAIRECFVKELGVELSGRGHIGMYLFGDKQYVVYNMSNHVQAVSLRFFKEMPTTGWKELVRDEQLKIKRDTVLVDFQNIPVTDVSLTIQPHEITLIQAP